MYKSPGKRGHVSDTNVSLFNRARVADTNFVSRGPFVERPGKLTGPVSYFEIEVSRKVGCVLTSNKVHSVSLAENFTV